MSAPVRRGIDGDPTGGGWIGPAKFGTGRGDCGGDGGGVLYTFRKVQGRAGAWPVNFSRMDDYMAASKTLRMASLLFRAGCLLAVAAIGLMPAACARSRSRGGGEWSVSAPTDKGPGPTAAVAPTEPAPAVKPGERLARSGDEIVVCGQLFHTGAPVVTWMDPGGYDAYRTDRRFAAYDKSSFSATTQEVKGIESPNRFGLRYYAPPSTQPGTEPSVPAVGTESSVTRAAAAARVRARRSRGAASQPTADVANRAAFTLSPEELEEVRGGGWPLELLQSKVDQFVIHYDVCGTSRQCFKVLHDMRGLSVHFMLDVDGTIYQTLDLKERAWHATTSNTRSIGIEIANIGAYPPDKAQVLDDWYRPDDTGHMRIVFPVFMKNTGIRTPGFIARPIRDEPVIGEIQGETLKMYDLTAQQYESLTKLTAALCKVFPLIKCDYPKDAEGKLITHKLPDEELARYQGVLGHYHVQTDKTDPGPAFQWDRVIDGAREMMGGERRGE